MEIVKTMDGNAAMLSLSGWLDTDGAARLSEALDGLEETVSDLVLDLDGLEYVTSMGLRQLVRAQRKMAQKGSLTIIRASSEVTDVLKMAGIYERLNVLS